MRDSSSVEIRLGAECCGRLTASAEALNPRRQGTSERVLTTDALPRRPSGYARVPLPRKRSDPHSAGTHARVSGADGSGPSSDLWTAGGGHPRRGPDSGSVPGAA